MWSSKYNIDFTYADGDRSWALVEEFYCYAKVALPCAQFDSEGVGFRDLWMAGNDPKTGEFGWDDESTILPLAMHAVCSALLAGGFEPSEWCDEVVEYMRDASKHPDSKGTFVPDIGTAAARRLGMALAYIS